MWSVPYHRVYYFITLLKYDKLIVGYFKHIKRFFFFRILTSTLI